MSRFLIVTVDTEEERTWGAQYSPHGHTVENIAAVPRFQRLCNRFGIRPTYLIDGPVVQDRCAVDLLREIHQEQRCEIGAHVHPWCNPPNHQPCTSQTSYLCNQPEPMQRDMLEWITETIEEKFGHRPTAFRAGRYGLDIVGARILRDLGYIVDSSVIPFSDFTALGGPNFSDASYLPYWIDGDNLCTPHRAGFLLEVPVSVGFNRINFRRAQAIQQLSRKSWLKPWRLEGILDRLRIVQRIKFSPEQADAAQMMRLVETYLAQSAPAMVLMFHSSSLLPAGSPYVTTPAELETFYSRLENLFEYCLLDKSMLPCTLSEFTRLHAPAVRGSSPTTIPTMATE